MKFNVQIQTVPFALIGTEYEGTIEGAVDLHNKLLGTYTASQKPLEGLTDKELDLIIQNMCLGKSTPDGTNLWSKATAPQKTEINRLKRALSRIKAKGEEPEVDYYGGGPGKGENGDYSNMD